MEGHTLPWKRHLLPHQYITISKQLTVSILLVDVVKLGRLYLCRKRFLISQPIGNLKNLVFPKFAWSFQTTYFYPLIDFFDLIDWHLLNQPTKITSVACFFTMQIFHTWENYRLADLKNSFYLLIISTKNKTVSTIT